MSPDKKNLINNFNQWRSKIGGKLDRTVEGISKKREESARKKAHRDRTSVVVPVGLQTVLAVLICCGVFLAAGAVLLTINQQEIADLKSDLKAYSDDGVIPAGSMEDSVAMNIDAVGARVLRLEEVAAAADDGLTTDQIYWFGSELAEVQEESDTLERFLDEIHAPKAMRKDFKDNVQSPLVSLQGAYDKVKISDDGASDVDSETGAATDTGTFKVSGKSGHKTLITVIVIVAVVLLAAFCFIFRKPLLALFSPKKGKRGKSSNRKEKRSSSRRNRKTPKAEPAADNTKKAPQKAAERTVPAAHKSAEELLNDLAGKPAPVTAEELFDDLAEEKPAPVTAEELFDDLAEEPSPAAAEDEALSQFADSLRLQREETAAEEQEEEPAERLIRFDGVASQSDIVDTEEDDSLFGGED